MPAGRLEIYPVLILILPLLSLMGAAQTGHRAERREEQTEGSDISSRDSDSRGGYEGGNRIPAWIQTRPGWSMRQRTCPFFTEHDHLSPCDTTVFFYGGFSQKTNRLANIQV